MRGRGQAVSGIGSSSVRAWAKTLAAGSDVLDLGCGTGIPITKILIEEGLAVHGIDASPSLARTFHENFPNMPIACEPAEESSFFDRKFDHIIAWGLIFLLPEAAQIRVIEKAANALNKSGKFIFTSPAMAISWSDAMTDLPSRSLGAEKYREVISASGLFLIEEFEDEGENHYYNCFKI